MKNTLLTVALIAILILLAMGCEEQPMSETSISDITIDGVDTLYCSGSDPCHYVVLTSFTDAHTGYNWYRGGLVRNGTTTLGKVHHMYSDGSSDVHVAILAPYFDFVNEALSYHVEMYRYASEQDAYEYEYADGAEAVDAEVVIGPFASDCFTCCCTETFDRYYAFAAKDTGYVIGVKADMTVYYPKLCGEDVDNTDSAQSGAWVGIQNKFLDRSPGVPDFVQVGYMAIRGGGQHVDEIMYLEVHPPGDPYARFRRIFDEVPIHGTTHKFELSIDPTAQWAYFVFNESKKDSFDFKPQYPWSSSTGRWVVWAGEIRGYETDMPGTGSNRTYFTGCEYKRDDGHDYRGADFREPDRIGTSDDSNWRIWFSEGSNSFEFWDLNPLPLAP